MVMESTSKNFKKKTREKKMRKQCKQCEEAFDAQDQFDLFCSKECKEEALAELDSDSDECLSCQ